VVDAQRRQAGVNSSAQPFWTCITHHTGSCLAQNTFGGNHEFVALTGELVAQRLAEIPIRACGQPQSPPTRHLQIVGLMPQLPAKGCGPPPIAKLASWCWELRYALPNR
jgi:hypothetical protein